jgi:hypothetical protein
MGRLRPADWVCGLGAIALGVMLLAAWLGSRSGWASVGWAGDVVVGLAVAGGLGICLTVALDRAPSVQVMTATGATVIAGVATIVVATEVIGPADVRVAAYCGLVSTALLTVACWRSMADERTDAATSAYAPPPARSAPPR